MVKMVPQPGKVAAKSKPNAKGAQKKGALKKKKLEIMKNGTIGAGGKGSGKRKEMEGDANEKKNMMNGKIDNAGKSQAKKMKKENAGGQPSPAGKTEGKNQVNGVASPIAETKGKNQKKMKVEVNGNASPKAKVGNKKQKKNMKTDTKKKNVEKTEGNENNKAVQTIEKIWTGLNFKEDDRMTKFEGFWVKKDAVDTLQAHKKSLMEKGLSEKQIRKGVVNAARKQNLRLRRELTRELKVAEKKKGGKQKVEFVNEEGKRVVVLGDGKVRPWVNIPYEENELMCRYDSVWVKKESVKELDELKASLKSKGIAERAINRQMIKAKRRAHKKLEKELKGELFPKNEKKTKGGNQNKENASPSHQAKFLTDADGQRVRVLKDGTKKTMLDLPFEENERMTKYENMWVKKDMVSNLDELKTSLQDQGLSEKAIKVKVKKAAGKAHKKLRAELIREQKALEKTQQGEDKSKKSSPAKKGEAKKMQKIDAAGQGVTENNTGKQEVNGKKKGKMQGGKGKQGKKGKVEASK